MTISTNVGLNAALSGLEAMQAGLDTTGQNIANASTPGYSEEVVDLGESTPLSITASSQDGTGAQLGTGVSVDAITRQNNAFLDQQYYTANASASSSSTLADQLNQVQTALGDSSSTGVSSALAKLWSAFDNLANDPGTAAQAAVTSAAGNLISTMQSVSGQMATVQSQAGAQLAQLAGTGGQVQQDADQIQALNVQIEAATAQGSSPNTLLDQRDKLVSDLSGLASTTVTQNPGGGGGITVTFAGRPLVDATNAVNLPAVSIYASSSGGQLGALADLADPSGSGAIQSLSDQLDQVAADVTGSVNAAVGANVFSGGSVASLAFDPSALSSVTPSAAASAAALSGGPADQGYAAFVGTVGTAVQTATNTNTTQQAVLTAISNQQQSVSGVSLDQEMTNLITYQQGYEASAKMMSTMQSVLQTLISSVGSAGL